ncbi:MULTISPECIES: poly-beta-1,6-N-acetyl-D-glucosamine biosynthesis protein PgaD [Tatumella]|uniref:Poly-beta-1,6-N-acetyl-D-glucosamine biosynthesis protein PgaD n=1 Tax=Tatumella punctata TaxID=399969 RepID=A0ABW1VN61_9GAMM|nr:MULTISPECIES: poly-beta-1,6-N-acetyl-D-glucosamine biosynthesis protein PgaD [unclassified Tatumella]MBS0876379.1 poly-beta-1,6-N-acetyl-D-glucosamine biosynthesis protein PgaD [Tatumella sp. JGM82]MBS0889552.1 poly-beta-1,6-N-acetyl-D-glucosamine biosynthesis protein PgaD [Tatumella sp. JGM94]MBS0900674.1 poly-beta-1,6-N-acetyl-D-glucosamine biosynthesis protein PgaD [Tatumella sp. JGM100]
MKDNLIVTQQDPVSMAFDVFLTIIAWVGFLYLIGSGIYDNITDKNLSFIKGTWSETTVTLCLYFSLMVIFAILLYGWAKYNYFRYRGKTSPRKSDLTSHELWGTFNMQDDIGAELQRKKVTVVHHDSEGQIYSVTE